MSTLLHAAWQALKQGDYQAAHSQTITLIKQDPRNPGAWMLLSEIVQDPAQRRDCLQRVLNLDPNNLQARQQLDALNRGTAPAAPVAPAAPPANLPTFTPGVLPTPDELQALAQAGQLPVALKGPTPLLQAKGMLPVLMGFGLTFAMLVLLIIIAVH